MSFVLLLLLLLLLLLCGVACAAPTPSPTSFVLAECPRVVHNCTGVAALVCQYVCGIVSCTDEFAVEGEYSCTQLAGEPDCEGYRDCPLAWDSSSSDAGPANLTVFLEHAVRASQAVFHEAFNPGFVVGLDAVEDDGAGAVVPLWRLNLTTALPPKAAYEHVVEIEPAGPLTRVYVVLVDTDRVSGWNSLDAVRVVGEPGSPIAPTPPPTHSPTLSPTLSPTSAPTAAPTRNPLRLCPQGRGPEYLCQFASAVLNVSSEYSHTGSYAAEQILGPPDTADYGDEELSWNTLRASSGAEYIVVAFPLPVQPETVLVYESHNPGALVGVDAAPYVPGQSDGAAAAAATAQFVTLWGRPAGMAPEEVPEVVVVTAFNVSAAVPSPGFATRVIRLRLNTADVSGYNTIDAVELRGSAVASCTDRLVNGNESDVDCGGSAGGCVRCALGAGCVSAADCASGVACVPPNLSLQYPPQLPATGCCGSCPPVTLSPTRSPTSSAAAVMHGLAMCPPRDTSGNCTATAGIPAALAAGMYCQWACQYIQCSSSYGALGSANSCAALLGEPNCAEGRYRDCYEAWTTRSSRVGNQVVEVMFAEAVGAPDLLRVVENYNPGALVQVELYNTLSARYEVAWSIGKSEAVPAGVYRVYEVPLRASFTTRRARLRLDTDRVSGYYEIDALQLRGRDPAFVTASPTAAPTGAPTGAPTRAPIRAPTRQPTLRPTLRPSRTPVQVEATPGPGPGPTGQPSAIHGVPTMAGLGESASSGAEAGATATSKAVLGGGLAVVGAILASIVLGLLLVCRARRRDAAKRRAHVDADERDIVPMHSNIYNHHKSEPPLLNPLTLGLSSGSGGDARYRGASLVPTPSLAGGSDGPGGGSGGGTESASRRRRSHRSSMKAQRASVKLGAGAGSAYDTVDSTLASSMPTIHSQYGGVPSAPVGGGGAEGSRSPLAASAEQRRAVASLVVTYDLSDSSEDGDGGDRGAAARAAGRAPEPQRPALKLSTPPPRFETLDKRSLSSSTHRDL